MMFTSRRKGLTGKSTSVTAKDQDLEFRRRNCPGCDKI